MGAVGWGVEGWVKWALAQVEVPMGLFLVPDMARTSVSQWGHSSKLTCHPGVTRELAAIRQHFWWPAMAESVSSWVLVWFVINLNLLINLL